MRSAFRSVLKRARLAPPSAPRPSRPRLTITPLEERAVPATWNNSSGGSFFTPGNWIGGVPGAGAEARFVQQEVADPVTLGGTSHTVGSLVLNELGDSVDTVHGTVRLDPGGATLTTGTVTVGDSREGSGPSTKAAGGYLILRNGTVRTGAADVGHGRTSVVPGTSTFGIAKGRVFVGAGGSLVSTGTVALGTAAFGLATLSVEEGGEVSAPLLVLGDSFNGSVSSGFANATGAGSVLDVNAVRVGEADGFYSEGYPATNILRAGEGGWVLVNGTVEAAGGLSVVTVQGGYLRADAVEALTPSVGTSAYPQVEIGGAGGVLRVRNLRAAADSFSIESGGTLVVAGGEAGLYQANGTLPATEVFQNGNVQLEDGRLYVERLRLVGEASVRGAGRVVGVLELPNFALSQSPRVQPGTNDFLDLAVLQLGGLELMRGTLDLEVTGTVPGDTQDQLDVTGPVTLGPNAVLDLNFQYTFSPPSGTVLTLVKNDGTDPVVGTFQGRPEGQTISVNGSVMRLSYAGGDGNDITLTALNQEPTIGGLGVSPGTVTDAGTEAVTLTATNVAAIDGRINDVTFYRDANGNGTFEEAADFRLGSVSGTGNGTYSWTGNLTGVSPGTYTLFARARRYTFSDVYYSNVPATTITVTAAPPVEQVAFPVGPELITVTSGANLWPVQSTRDAAGFTTVFVNTSTGAFARRHDPAGQPVSFVQVLEQDITDAAMMPDGRFMVVWQDGTHVYARRHNADGTTASGVIQVSTVPDTFYDGSRISPRVAVDGAGGFLVAWFSGNYTIEAMYYRRFAADNTPLTPPVPYDTNERDGPVGLAMDAAGNAVLAWGIQSQNTVVARTISPTGVAGPVFYVGGDYPYADGGGAVQVGFRADGGFVIAWAADDVVYRRYSADGVALDPAPVPVGTPPQGASPRLVVAPTGHFAVFWQVRARDPGDGEFELGVYGQVVSPAGQLLGGNFRVPTTIASSQYLGGVTADGGLDFLVCWGQLDPAVGPFGTITSIRVQRFTVDLPPTVPPVPAQAVGRQAKRTFRPPAVDPDGQPVAVTAINGTAVAIGGNVTLPSGARVTRNADGTLTYEPRGAVPVGAVDSFAYTAGDGTKTTTGAADFRIAPDLAAAPAQSSASGNPEIAFTEVPANAATALQLTVRGVGADGVLGTADDSTPTVTPNWRDTTLVLPGLAAGLYRVTIDDALADETGRLLDGNGDGTPGGDFVADLVARPFAPGLDGTFAGDGTTTVNPTPGNEDGRTVVVQPDGKVVIVGTGSWGASLDFVVTRLNVDGTLDLTFGSGGVATADFAGLDDEAADVVLQPDGKIVVVGTARLPGSPSPEWVFGVARFDANGYPDYAFSDDGLATYNAHAGFTNEAANAVAVQPDGRIVVSGFGHDAEFDDAFTTIRLHDDGTLDPTFGVGGRVATDASGFDYPADVAVQPDGKIVVTGALNEQFGALRYRPDGTLDPAFGTGGVTTIPLGEGLTRSYVDGLALQPDGAIVLVGSTEAFPRNLGALVRLRADGVPDPTFGGGDGVVITAPPLSETTYLMDAVVQPDGKIVAVGVTSSDAVYALAFRYLPDGTPDLGFGTGGVMTLTPPGAFGLGYGAALTSDRRLVVSGRATSGGQNAFLAGRLAVSPTVALAGVGGTAFEMDAAGPGAGRVAGEGLDGLTALRIGPADFAPPLPANSLADDNRTFVTGAQTIAGLAVSRAVTVPADGPAFARTIDTFANAGASPVSTVVQYVSNLGSDAATVVFATSDGDTVVEPSDWWVGTDDADGAGGPAVIHVLGGPRGLEPTGVQLAGDSLVWTYNLTVAAGQTARLGTFAIPAPTRAQAQAALDGVVTRTGLTPTGGAYLTPAEVASLANVVFLQAPTTVGALADLSGAEDATLPPVPLRPAFADAEDGAAGLTYSLVSGGGLVTGTVDPGTDELTLVPRPHVHGTATVTVRATDTDGLSVEQSFRVTLAPTPDAPAVDVGRLFMLPEVARNTASPPGISVASLLRTATNPDGSAAAFGIAVTAVGETAGRWEYATAAGGLWVPLPAVSASSAFLLARTAVVRFVPARNQAGHAGLQFRAWDGITWSPGDQVNVAAEPLAFSTDEVAWVPVGVNRPRFDAQGRAITPGLAEDAAGRPTVAKTLLGLLATEFAAGTKLGLAVTGTTGNGTWQVKVGRTWQPIANASETSARLVKPTDQVRFIPAADWVGDATLTYRAWKVPAGTTVPTTGDVTADPASYSAERLTAVAPVTPVNDAPRIDLSVPRVFGAAPRTVQDLLTGATDVDGTVTGLAVTRATGTNGAWEYRPSATDPWEPVGRVSAGKALLLGLAAELRFVPAAGATAAAGRLDYRVIDDSVAFASGDRGPATGGGFGRQTETATFSLGNAAPTFEPGDAPAFKPAALGRGGQPVSALLGRMSDTRGSLEGIAVTGTTGSGTWEFTVDGGRTWQVVGVQGSQRLLLRSTDRLRFTPTAGGSGTATLSFAAWDRTAGVAGDRPAGADDSHSAEVLTATLTLG